VQLDDDCGIIDTALRVACGRMVDSNVFLRSLFITIDHFSSLPQWCDIVRGLRVSARRDPLP
jgi:hypothetical protein